MIRRHVIDRGVTDETVINAMRSIPRDRFFSPDDRDDAFLGQAAPIGYGQTISEPYIVALMTQAMQLDKTQRVLELGTGTGYHTAILGKLCAEVYSIERIKPLLDDAFERLLELNIRNVKYRHGDGTNGWPEAAPFDRITIAAGAPQVPKKLLLSQLKDGGIAVLPHGPMERQMLVSVTRSGEHLHITNLCPCRFVKLIGAEGWPEE
jgi:protein-L-isoaspartate(D-aspartate) O-methyltransferase